MNEKRWGHAVRTCKGTMEMLVREGKLTEDEIMDAGNILSFNRMYPFIGMELDSIDTNIDTMFRIVDNLAHRIEELERKLADK